MSRQFSTCYVDDLLFGLDVLKVREVVKYQSITPAPLSEKHVLGLINLRGQIITAIDLGVCLGLEESKLSQEERMNMVVYSEGEPISLVVDQVGDVVEVDDELYEDPPETLSPKLREYVNGIFKLDDTLLLVLDVDKLLGSGEDK
ncbi:MAG: chemotaxis protein CheW [Candidatus Dadabacteria bacterium]|nr:MAG: chemotaxis protein CheW [Candidatus Dadabacteria bacterium]